MKHHDVKLVVFDMAGTTVEDQDFVHLALMEAMSEEQIDVSRNEVNDVMGYPKPVAISRLLRLKKGAEYKIRNAYINKIHDLFVDKMVEFYQSDPRVKEKEGTGNIFRLLRQYGIKVAIDTGFNRRIADAIINRLHWHTDLVDASVTSDEVSNGRPYPDMIFKAMELTGVHDVRQVAKVGDTASDLLQGESAGCSYVIGVTTGAFDVATLKTYYHTHLIEKLAQLKSVLELN